MSEAALLLAAKGISAHFTLGGVVSLVAGILILIFPRLLNYIVGIYLVIVGLAAIFNVRVF